MIVATSTRPRAFAVWFKDLVRWNPSSFVPSGWNWPHDHIKSLKTALKAKHLPADKDDSLPMITIRFDGEMEQRNSQSKIKGKLFLAHAGDVVYSKIDVRNGAIGIVPESLSIVAVTSEFPVYEVNQDIALPLYIKLFFRTEFFRRTINGMISGASGRKRVQPTQLIDVDVPLPPLSAQQTIVDFWQQTQAEIAARNAQIAQTKRESDDSFLQSLGFTEKVLNPMPKAFAANWGDIFTWNGRATYLALTQGDVHCGNFPVVRGEDCLAEVCHGCSASPSPVPTELEVLKISAVTRGELVPSEKKYAFDNAIVRKQFSLRKGDVLLCRTNGTLAYVGMSALIMDDIPNLIFPDKVIRVRVKECILPEYLWLVLQTPPLRAQIEAAARTAVGNYAIGGKDIWSFEIPLPPLDVQRLLVDKVKTAKAEIARIREEAERLAQESKAEIEEMILGTKSADQS